MEKDKDNPEENKLSDKLNEVISLRELMHVILDYYDFKAESNDSEGEEWKKGTKLDNDIIPENIDTVIQNVFLKQLKSFLK
jgi:hypothetical protein